MFKKILIAIISFVLLISATACQNNDNPNSSGTGEIPDEATYLETPKAPEYATVDVSDYTKYYFDANDGNDNNDGLSEANAKKSLSALNNIVKTVNTPTQFLLKAGTTFLGNMILSNYVSTNEKPLLIDVYGKTESVVYPIIQANGGDGAIVLSGDNARINGLEITNVNGNKGIYVVTSKKGASENIVIENCYIHDVKWKWEISESVEEMAVKRLTIEQVRAVCPDNSYSYGTSGIYFFADKGDGINPRWFSNVWVRNNNITRVGRAGIITDSVWQSGNGCGWGGCNKFRTLDDGWYPPDHFVISNNNVTYVGGDAIVTIGMQDCWLERNYCFHTAMLGRYGNACAGIWPVNARRIYIQYNEASYTHLDNGCTDGQGFDIDIGCSDVIFQYNYSHHNEGGGLLICNVHSDMPLYNDKGLPVMNPETGKQETFESAGFWNNVKIRNNLFVDNGIGGKPAFLYMSSDCKNIICENNTVIMNDIQSPYLIFSADYGQCGKQDNLILRNNIFYSRENRFATISLDCCETSIFENNLYYNFPESFFNEWTGIVDAKAIRDIDPQITIPTDMDGYDKVALFRPNNAQVFTMGMKLKEYGKYDVNGNLTEGVKYVGAYCK